MVQRGAMPRRAAAQTPASSKTKQYTEQELNDIARGQGVFPEGSPALPTGLVAPAAPPRADNITPPKKAGLDAITQPQQPTRSQAEQDYLAQLMGVGEKTRGGISDIKKQGLGEALMQIGAGLFSAPTLGQGLAKGLPLASSTAAATRKEARALEKEANEYDLNLARYRAALDAGDKDRAFKYKQAADENRYRMAMVNKPDSGIALLNALKDPKMMELYQQMNMAKKPTDTLDREKAAALWQKLTRNEKKDYGNDFETYFRGMNNQLLSATIPGQGATTRPY